MEEAPLRLSVEFELSDAQRTKAIAKGMVRGNLEKLVLPVDPSIVKMLDPARVRVTRKGRLIILDRVERENEYDLDKEPRIYLSESGLHTDITDDLIDYIIENGKTTFDADCLSKLYELQDRAIERARKEVEEVRESIRRSREIQRKKEEARELLKDEIEAYRKRIKELEEEVSRLKDRISELEGIVESYTEFIREKELEKEFINYVKEKESEELEEEIREKYGLG
jgi:archaellum component FlaC